MPSLHLDGRQNRWREGENATLDRRKMSRPAFDNAAKDELYPPTAPNQPGVILQPGRTRPAV